MATIQFNDTHIDNLVWNAIVQSHCSKDYESYLELFQNPMHDNDACNQIERLLHEPSDTSLASACFSDAVTKLGQLAVTGDMTAQFFLGKCYGIGAGTEANWDKAYTQYTLAGIQGELRGYANIANAYHNGRGVEKSYTKAFEYFEKAYAIAHDGMVVWTLARMYIHGYGVTKDVVKGVELLMQEIELGDSYVQAIWGTCKR